MWVLGDLVVQWQTSLPAGHTELLQVHSAATEFKHLHVHHD